MKEQQASAAHDRTLDVEPRVALRHRFAHLAIEGTRRDDHGRLSPAPYDELLARRRRARAERNEAAVG